MVYAMKSFRAEIQNKNASLQVLLTLLVLLAVIVIASVLPAGVKMGKSEKQNSSWESSVVKLP